MTSTLGKALGGASGGFTAAPQEVVDLLRQRSRPYLFSNTLAPAIVGASIACLDMLEDGSELIEKLAANTKRFREGMTKAGFDIRPGEHPIVPVMLGDARLASGMADDLLDEGIYVIGFSYPVVPKGQARIRVQISAAHTTKHGGRRDRGVHARGAEARGGGVAPSAESSAFSSPATRRRLAVRASGGLRTTSQRCCDCSVWSFSRRRSVTASAHSPYSVSVASSTAESSAATLAETSAVRRSTTDV